MKIRKLSIILLALNDAYFDIMDTFRESITLMRLELTCQTFSLNQY